MTVLIFGASGLIGRALTAALNEGGHRVVAATRDRRRVNDLPADVREWNPREPRLPVALFEGVDAVVNLAGANIAAKRWTRLRKQEILDSRVGTNRKIVQALEQRAHPPRVFVTGSAVGYYGSAHDRRLTEGSPAGNDFLARVCRQLEQEALKAVHLGVRTIALRTGVVLSADGGALPKMMRPFRFGLGGWLGSGKQWFPWIHIEDLVRIILFLLENDHLQGAVNGVAPGIVNSKQFAKLLGKTLTRPTLFPVPAAALRLLLGEVAQALLASQRVVPEKLQQAGFRFRFPELKMAFEDLLIDRKEKK